MTSVGSGRRRSHLVSLALCLAIVGCGGGGESTGPHVRSIAGRWEGSAALGAVHFGATFTQTGGAVSGTGTFTSPLGSGPFTAAGTVMGDDVSLALTSADFGATTYIGRFTSATRIEGHLDDAAYGGLGLTLEKQ